MILAALIINLLPLYVLISLGYVAGRYLEVNLDSMAKILIYFLLPFVSFGAVAQIDFSPELLLLPIAMTAISAVVALPSYRLSRKFFTPRMASLIGMSSATGNTGYFGLPLVIALLGNDVAGIYLMMNFGITVSEVTLAYYLGARGNHTVAESIARVFRLPVLYAILAALAFNGMHIELPAIVLTYWEHAKGAWVLLGMMLIGIALGKCAPLVFNWKMMGWLGAVKFVAWPLLALGFVWCDKAVLHLFDESIHLMITVVGIVPLAGNTVAYAAQLKVHPEEAAMAVLVSTLFALAYIPAVLWLTGFY